MKNAAAVALGKMARGVPKTLSEDQRAALAQRMRDYHAKRREAKETACPEVSVSVNSTHECGDSEPAAGDRGGTTTPAA